jgi:hypothetical protein
MPMAILISFTPSVTIRSIMVLSVVMLNVVMMNVVAPFKGILKLFFFVTVGTISLSVCYWTDDSFSAQLG